MPRWNNRGKNWNSNPIRGARHPPGLRGRNIGLFYRDRARNNPNFNKELIISFTIPPSIKRAVQNQVQSIRSKAKEDNIDLSFIENFKLSQKSPFLEEPKSDKDSDSTEPVFKKPTIEYNSNSANASSKPSSSKSLYERSYDATFTRSLGSKGDFKYGYHDLISSTFDEKLDECISKGISINSKSEDVIQLNKTLLNEQVEMVEKERYKDMLKFREMLPTYKKSKELLDIISNNSVVVISGETGCGKSTQVPQLILDDAIMKLQGGNTKIVVTQPRRIAATSLAERVADERAESLGQSVGYAVRLDKIEPRSRGSITFCTTGVLLVDLEMNQGLTNYSHIILDEVHERDTHVDLTMFMLKKILQKRKDLKVILMSATLNAEGLSKYFDDCDIFHIEGLAYPVQDIFLENIIQMLDYRLPEEEKDKFQRKKKHHGRMSTNDVNKLEKQIQYRAEIGPWIESIKHNFNKGVYETLLDPRIEDLNIDLLVQLLIHICKGAPGAVLVFLPGIAAITTFIKIMNESNAFPSSIYDIYPLHSKLPTLQQKLIFERPPMGIRKIIIATNIAETSITIDDIVYVIDCGKIKMKGLNVKENVATLQNECISQANLRQRRGRAGRCQKGICYHALTSYRAGKIAERVLPELQRSNLLEALLTIKRLRLGKAEEALKFVPDPPADSTVQWAVKHLQQCGALNENEILTPLGWHLARLPVHPAAGKLLLLGALFGCLDRAASVAAVWGFKDPFMMVIGKEDLVDNAKRELTLGEPSDHVAISEAIIHWENIQHRERKDFAYEYFLSNNTLQLLSEMKDQFAHNLKEMGFLCAANIKSDYENRNSDNLSLFKAIIAAALYPNVGTVKWRGLKSKNIRKPVSINARTPENGSVEIHPSSVMATLYSKVGQGRARICNNPGANWLVYWLKQRSTKLFLLEVTLVYSLPLLFFGEMKVTYDDEFPEHCFMSISTIKVKCLKETAELLFELRALLDHVLANKVTSVEGRTVNTKFQELVLKAVTELITAEDEQTVDGDDSYSDSDQSDSSRNQRYWR